MERCTICGSSSWCGRPCANDPMANTGGDMANREETMANSLPDMANTSEDMANSGDPKKRIATATQRSVVNISVS